MFVCAIKAKDPANPCCTVSKPHSRKMAHDTRTAPIVQPQTTETVAEGIIAANYARQYIARLEASARARMVVSSEYIELQRACVELQRQVIKGEHYSAAENARLLRLLSLEDMESAKTSASACSTLDKRTPECQERVECLEQEIYIDIVNNASPREVRDQELVELADALKTRNVSLEATHSSVLARTVAFGKRAISNLLRVQQ